MLWLFPCLSMISLAHGHGSMVEPPSRAVMADHGFPSNPRDYNWMEGFCGGKGHQWSEEIGGRCGICGDAWDAEIKEHEAPGGKFANGVIVRHYRPGQVITVTSHITANHVVSGDNIYNWKNINFVYSFLSDVRVMLSGGCALMTTLTRTRTRTALIGRTRRWCWRRPGTPSSGLRMPGARGR